MIKIECLAGHGQKKNEEVVVYVTRAGIERRHQVSQAGQRRLAKLVHKLILKRGGISLRPFLGGLGWVAEIEEVR